MTIAFWIINIVLCVAFLGAGGMKLVRDKAALKASHLDWVDDFSAGAVKAIGAAEVLGALGLVLPRLVGVAAVLAPVAASCLTLLMVGAVIVHLRRHETAVPAIVLAVLSALSAVIGFLVVL